MVRKRGSNIGLAAIFAILVFCSFNINWGKERWKDIIKYDAFGYYSYLPATLIYKDPNFNFIDRLKAKYPSGKASSAENIFLEVNGNRINKYYCGTALAQLPFFTAAHLFSDWFNYDQDGYSKLYLVFINLAAIFYLLIGLIFLRKFLDHLQLPENQIFIVLAAAVFGTNIFYYTIIEPGMSHIYSFAFITMFLYFSQQYFKQLVVWRLLVLAALLGIITLIRPINFIVVFLLFFTAGSLNNFKAGLNRMF